MGWGWRCSIVVAMSGCGPDTAWDGTCTDEVYEGDVIPRDVGSLAGHRVVNGDLAINFDVSGPADLDRLGCLERVEGLLQILGDGEMERAPEDLSALRSLRAVGDGLYLRSTVLESLDGLESLESIGDDLTLMGLGVRDVDGLSGLRQVGSLRMLHNPNLENVDGFSGVHELSTLGITGEHPALEHLDGFENLRSVGFLWLEWCPPDGDLSAFSSVRSLDRVWIGDPLYALDDGRRDAQDCEKITTLSPLAGSDAIETLTLLGTGVASLEGLTFAADIEGLSLRFNVALTDLSRLSAVRSIQSDLTIEDNTALMDLDHLDPDLEGALEALGGDLHVTRNDALPTCAAEHLRDALIDRGWSGEAWTPNADCPDGQACNGPVCE